MSNGVEYAFSAVLGIAQSQAFLATIRVPPSIKREGNQEGPLFGEVVVFTGALTISRKEAADLAAQAGCEVVPTVKRTTTLLVVGDQDIKNLAGHDRSAKHRKAEELVAKGQNIRILCESDFQKLLSLSW